MFDLLIRNCTIVNGGERPVRGSVAIRGEKVAAILEPHTEVAAHVVIDADGHVLFPGLIDPHVHYHYPYGYRSADTDYSTETESALVGGVTTAIRMHRDQRPLAEHLPSEIGLLESQSRIDMAFHLALMTEAHLQDFPEHSQRQGINSFKLYMAYKGKAGELQGILGADDGYLFEAMRRIGRYPGGVACVHAENSEIIERLASDLRNSGREGLEAWADARPGWVEKEAVTRAGYLARQADCPLYIVHISSAEGVSAIEHLRSREVRVYAEVCVHHLTTTWDSPLGNIAKVNPPLRHERDLEALWDAVSRGVVDTVATDHVAHTTAKADVPFWEIMPGNPGTATMLPALLTFGYHKGRLTLSQIASLLSKNASEIFDLPEKGRIAVGADADLVVVDVEKECLVSPNALHSSSDYSLFQGMVLRGWPIVVILRGQIVLEDGEVKAPPGFGRFLRRGPQGGCA
jgi:dihydropyrimidinase